MIAPHDPHATLADLRAGRLAGATRLDLRHAGLDRVPPEVLALGDTLEALDLSGNRLEALPPDFERLHRLRVLFASNNRFAALPDVLGRCRELDICGFKANAIAHVPAAALPASLRWLILTDNRVESLPDSLAACTRLRKLMLAGNRLARLPDPSGWQRLELVRLAANRFERRADALPEALLALPRLAWIAFGGNPFNAGDEARALAHAPVPDVAWGALSVGTRLGEGASGIIHAATLGGAALAVKLFKGEVTSDGLPASEMAACVAAGTHRDIVGVAGVVAGHPQGARGLVMRRIPPGYRNLAGPPSLASCARDVYPDDLRLAAPVARAIAQGVADALAHLHARGVLHGDLYAHNLLVDAAGHALLGDFGAASLLPADDPALAEALVRLDRRALGVLVDELASRCDDPRALRDQAS
ncbi:MAG: leucine-rich repeat-containing protein kinase family protein [Burkholderiaceae bacterium]